MEKKHVLKEDKYRSMKNKRISKILGWGLSSGLIFASVAAIFASPVAADEMEWGIVNTPSWEDLVILPASDILDYDIGGDGDIIYAVLAIDSNCTEVGWDEEDGTWQEFALVKSTDGGVTWSDITANVAEADNLPDLQPNGELDDIFSLTHVSVAPDDEDWVVVAGIFKNIGPFPGGAPFVVASKDGGSNFSYTGDMEDVGAGTMLEIIHDLDVSIEVDDIHNIAVAGEISVGPGADGTIYRLQAGTWLSAAWEDTTAYLGWDTGVTAGSDAAMVAVFSPNFDIDDTIVFMTVDDTITWDMGLPFLQSGIWEGGGGTYNDEAGFPDAVLISADGDTLYTAAYPRSMGLALPADYDGSDPGARAIYVYVNAFNMTTNLLGGFLMRVDNGSVSEPYGPSGEPILASIDFHGDADTGKMMIGEYFEWDNNASSPPGSWVHPDCAAGVRVWHTVELDPCCPNWELACKNPSGLFMGLVMYTPDGDKEYATTSGFIEAYESYGGGGMSNPGNPGDESAFSVSLDDGVSFNQIGLIDTDIDGLADMAICPDCSVIYLTTVNKADGVKDCSLNDWLCQSDSVWRSYDDGDTWERIYHGEWTNRLPDNSLLLRLPTDETENCCTVYLGIGNTDELYYSRDCGQCWNSPPATKIVIQDFAVASENVVYILDNEGMVSKSTQYGRRWSDAEDTGLDSGHTITSCSDQGLVVVGGFGDDPVAWTDDEGDSWNTTDDVPEGGEVHVACDPTCEGTIYAAVDGAGIFRTTTDSGAWDNLNAMEVGYTGIVVAREGTLYASSMEIGVDSGDPCLTKFDGTDVDETYSGVARNLTPCETACCGTEDWDYLIAGLSPNPDQKFRRPPSSLKICGCLSVDSNSILWAIDSGSDYNVTDGSDGALWSYEDCAAKSGITLTAPADNTVLDCEPCAGCDAASFTLKWERMCLACSYDIQIMDEDGNLIVEWVDEDITGDPPALYIDGTLDSGHYYLECGTTYTWQVREANTASECVHSPWSETWTFTIAVGAADAIKLLAPDSGAMGVPINSVAFSWSSVINADSYSFILAPNANLTGALVSMDMGDTAYNFVGPLEFGKAYYWKVVAWKDGTILTTSNVGAFNTEAAPVPSTPPVVVETTPAPVITIPPTQMITPTWIYAIIGIGAALAVVVIVLIVRTRRP